MIILTVTYPNAKGARFDWNYYKTAHLPMVGRNLGSFGLTSASVLKGEPGADGSDPPVIATAILSFASLDMAKSALSSEGAREVLADIANFTDVVPVMQFNSAVP